VLSPSTMNRSIVDPRRSSAAGIYRSGGRSKLDRVRAQDAFEAAIEQHIMAPRFDWPEIPPAQHCCTMAAASALGLPARLSMAADALELANRKDVAGGRLMHQMLKPRRARQGEDPSQVHWFDDDDRLRRLRDYCRQDVEVERELFDRLPLLSATE
jgi:DNA polymerase